MILDYQVLDSCLGASTAYAESTDPLPCFEKNLTIGGAGKLKFVKKYTDICSLYGAKYLVFFSYRSLKRRLVLFS